MRIVGGQAKGRALRVPRALEIRPTSDRVREAIFDVLTHLDLLHEASVLDLFAGTGALGIEAASRGASSVLFVDSDRNAIQGIEANVAATGVGEDVSCRAIRSDALSFCRSHSNRFDLALVDPPYAYEQWGDLLAVLPASFVVIESNRSIDLPDDFELHRTYRYGTTLVSMATRPAHGAER